MLENGLLDYRRASLVESASILKQRTLGYERQRTIPGRL